VLAYRVLMENGECMAAVAAVRGAENRLLGARGHDAGAAPAPLQRAIIDAGRRCMPKARQALAMPHARRGACVGRTCMLCARGCRGHRNSRPMPTLPLSPRGQLFSRPPFAVSLALIGRCRCAQVAAEVTSRSEWEVFYTAPSHSAPAFFAAVDALAAPPRGEAAGGGAADARQGAGDPDQGAAVALEQLAELARAVQVPPPVPDPSMPAWLTARCRARLHARQPPLLAAGALV